jgi:hypothetical protein
VYEGAYKGGARHGQGSLKSADGSRYEGQWQNDGSNGKGTLYRADGTWYNGEWKGGKKHGQGAEYDAEGITIIVFDKAHEGHDPSLMQQQAEIELPHLRGNWQPDFSSSSCTRCIEPFTLVRIESTIVVGVEL